MIENIPWMLITLILLVIFIAALLAAVFVLFKKLNERETVEEEDPPFATQEDLTNAVNTISNQVGQAQGAFQVGITTNTELVGEVLQEFQTWNTAWTNPIDAGDIGEMSLDIFLEQSGLADDHYSTQTTYALPNGDTLRPDAEILLPGNGKVLIDAKTPARAWVESIREEDPEIRQDLLEQNADSLKNMARELSTRGYDQIEGFVTPDVLVMYIPLDVIYYEFKKVVGNDFLTEANKGFLNNQGRRGVPIIFAPPSLIGGFLRMLKFLWRERNTYEDNTELVTNIVNFANNLKFLARNLVEGGALHVKAGHSFRKAFSRLGEVRTNINDLSNLVDTEDLENQLDADFMNVPQAIDIDEQRLLEWLRSNPDILDQITNQNGEEPED